VDNKTLQSPKIILKLLLTLNVRNAILLGIEAIKQKTRTRTMDTTDIPEAYRTFFDTLSDDEKTELNKRCEDFYANELERLTNEGIISDYSK